MNIGSFNLKIFGLALLTSVIIFGLIYRLNTPRPQVNESASESTATTNSNSTIIPQLTPETSTASIKLDEQSYRAQAQSLASSTALAANNCLQAFSDNPYLLADAQTPSGREFIRQLDVFSQNYNIARTLMAPDKLLAVHQELLQGLATLHQAQVDFLSAIANLDDDQATSGYSHLEEGSRQLAQVSTKL
ncbi:hypothetical protein IJJ08_03140 [bacterium]|nr:hypothetical protein [bacterium]